ncbi:MAG: DUF1573 domain-containing protein [Phaeodactylibacter sp.]|nr:DUF1573 domain-containing protein [Phaeodactylibacter sp.]
MEKVEKIGSDLQRAQKLVLIALLFVVMFAFMACSGTSSEEKTVEEIPADGKIASIIRNPVTASEPVDTVNVAKLKFGVKEHDFGSIREGQVVEHQFEFTNVGTVPLLISNVRSSCGCTAPEWPKEPIAPGKKGKIQVRFNSSGKAEQQQKPVIITANTFPPETKLSIKAYVEKDPAAE